MFVTLGEDDEHAVALLHIIDQLDGTLAPYCERNDGVRKNDRIADGKNWQLFGNRLDFLLNIIELFEVSFHGHPKIVYDLRVL